MDDADGVGDIETQRDVRVLAPELPEQRGYDVLGDRGAGTDDEGADDVSGELANLVVHLFIEIEYLPGIFVYTRSSVGEAYSIMGTIEQTRVEVLFELANLERDRGLGHVQGFSRLGEAQQPRDGCENL